MFQRPLTLPLRTRVLQMMNTLPKNLCSSLMISHEVNFLLLCSLHLKLARKLSTAWHLCFVVTCSKNDYSCWYNVAMHKLHSYHSCIQLILDLEQVCCLAVTLMKWYYHYILSDLPRWVAVGEQSLDQDATCYVFLNIASSALYASLMRCHYPTVYAFISSRWRCYPRHMPRLWLFSSPWGVGNCKWTNMMFNEIPLISEGLSSVSTTQEDTRKRPGYYLSVEGHLSKRTFQGNIDVVPTISEAAITCLSDLTRSGLSPSDLFINTRQEK